jgi:RNA polymerase sigma factor (sigma-70 family)
MIRPPGKLSNTPEGIGKICSMTFIDNDPDQERTRLLESLRGPDRSAAWRAFLARYAGLIHDLCARAEINPDRRSDCFIFVCEKLIDNNFARLLKYRMHSSASFRSWLKVVVSNLCIDWRRHVSGRLRPFRSIDALPPLEQAVFHHRFLQNHDQSSCLEALRVRFPELTDKTLTDAIRRINSVLTQRQRWLLQARHVRLKSIDEKHTEALTDIAPGPEQLAEGDQQNRALARAMDLLSDHERLLIRFRFEQDLSFREIARLTRLGDPFRARRQVHAALDRLAGILEQDGISRKNRGRVR